MDYNKYKAYNERFNDYYTDFLSRCSAKQLVKFEQGVSKFIDSDLFEDSILSDEMVALFELIRDECVHRVAGFPDLND